MDLCIKRHNVPNGIKWTQDNIWIYLPLLIFGPRQPGSARRAGVLAEAPLVRSWCSTWNTGFCLELAESKDRPRAARAEAMAARRPQAPTLRLEAEPAQGVAFRRAHFIGPQPHEARPCGAARGGPQSRDPQGPALA